MKLFSSKVAILFVIFVIGAFLRFYGLGVVPSHLNWDEASNGYNAYSVLKTGRDEYGNFMPFFFRSFGDYNLALSVYTLVPSIALFGLNQFAVRFPSAFLGSLTILLAYFLAFMVTRKKLVALLTAFFLSISPWHLQFSRYDHEANFMLFFSLLGTVAFLRFKNTVAGLVLASVSFGFAINTYHGAKVWVPLMVILLTLTNYKNLKVHKIKLAIPVLIFILFCLPIVLNLRNSLIRGQSTGIFQKQNFSKVLLSNYLSHYDLNFLFTRGDNIGRHSVGGMGQLYMFEFPLIMIGLFGLLRSSNPHKIFLVGWFLVAALPASLANPSPHALRAITFLPLYSLFGALGMSTLLDLGKFKRTLIVLVICAIGIYNFISYIHLYYVHEPNLKAIDWQDGYRQMLSYILDKSENYNTIAITSFYNQPYIFTLFYTAYDPRAYQDESGSRYGFGKYEFFKDGWLKTRSGKALIVAAYWQGHPPKVLKNIYGIEGDLRFIIAEE